MSKKHDCTAMSLVEAEYVALSTSYAQVIWMRTQVKDYGFDYNKIPLYCDSQSAIAISCNLVQYSHTKHIHTRYHFIKEQVECGIIELYFVRTEYQLANIFTKALPEDRFQYLVKRIGMRWLTPAELENIRVILFSIHNDDGNPSRTIIKQALRSQDGKDDQDIQGKDLKISEQKIKSKDNDKGSRSKITQLERTSLQQDKDQDKDSRTKRHSNLNKVQGSKNQDLSLENSKTIHWRRLLASKYICEHGSSESTGNLTSREICGGGGVGCGGTAAGEEGRVRESDLGDWVDPVTRIIFGVHRKTPPEKFSGGGDVVVAGMLAGEEGGGRR
ncbi:hypothetical protein Tco_1327958 [Tanacetum coccineum]